MKHFALISVAAVSLLASSRLFADTGIFGTDLGLESNLINGGTPTFFEADLLGDSRHAPLASGAVTLPVDLNTSGFNGLNLGTFNPSAGDTLTLVGGEALTFKNNGGGSSGTDVTGTFVNYSIDGGSFMSLSLPFNEDNVSGTSGDQRWASDTYDVNVLTGLSLGTHTIAFFASGTTNGNQIFDSNGGANYTASFTVVPEPSTWAMGSLVALGLAGSAFRRFRRVA